MLQLVPVLRQLNVSEFIPTLYPYSSAPLLQMPETMPARAAHARLQRVREQLRELRSTLRRIERQIRRREDRVEVVTEQLFEAASFLHAGGRSSNLAEQDLWHRELLEELQQLQIRQLPALREQRGRVEREIK